MLLHHRLIHMLLRGRSTGPALVGLYEIWSWIGPLLGLGVIHNFRHSIRNGPTKYRRRNEPTGQNCLAETRRAYSINSSVQFH